MATYRRRNHFLVFSHDTSRVHKSRKQWYAKPSCSFASRELTYYQEGDVNPFTKKPHSAQYKKILQARKKLPVFTQMDEFLKMVS